MARFSIRTALGDAFALVGHRPLSVLVWGLLVLAPSVVGLALLLPVFTAITASLDNGAIASADMVRLQFASMLMNAGQWLAVFVVYTAIMRAVLRPGARAVFSLRLHMDELRVAVFGIAALLGASAAMVVVMLLGGGIAAALWSISETAGWIGLGVLGLAAFATLLVAAARISLIAPASVLFRDFAFAQGWGLARGHILRLALMMLAVIAIVLLIEVLVMLVVAGGLYVSGASRALAGAMAGFDSDPAGVAQGLFLAYWPWMAAGGVCVAFVYGLLHVLVIAPFASACGQLAEAARPAPDEDPSADGADLG